MSNIVNLSQEEFETFISEGIALVDYWAPWCGPCKMLTPILQEVFEQVGNQVKFAKVNVDTYPSLAKAAEVKAIPNICIYKDGKFVDRMIGFNNTMSILEFIEKYLKT